HGKKGLHLEVSSQEGLVSPDTTLRPVTLNKGNEAADEYLDGIDQLVIEGSNTIESDGSSVPLWRVGGKPAAVVAAHGKGRILAVADPSLLTRRGLARADNDLFLAYVADLHAED